VTDPNPASLPDAALLAACKKTATTSGGPGGQHRNRVHTNVVLLHQPTGVRATAGERRKRIENQRVALRRLRRALAAAVRRPFTTPSDAWRARVKGGRLVLSPRHADVPRFLAEALDALAASEFDGKAAAERLGVSRTQLVKLLALHRPALEVWNDARRASGLTPLRT